MTDLDVIQPAATSASFNGRAITIEPLKVGQLPAFARAVKPISGAIGTLIGGGGMDAIALMDMIGEHGESVVQAVSIATGVPVEELNSATPDQLVDLAAVAMKVNADFFKGRLTPAILAAVKLATPGPGQTP